MITEHQLPHHHNDNCGEIISHIPDNDVIQSVADAMKQLGDPTSYLLAALPCRGMRNGYCFCH